MRHGRLSRSLLAALLVIAGLGGSAHRTAAATWVFNGSKQKKGAKYHYVVELRSNGNPVCAGVAIGKHWVLTAAHCLKVAVTAVPFTDGSLDILKRCTHPSYVSSAGSGGHQNARHDLGMLKVDGQLPDTWQRGDIGAPSADGLIVFGWGLTGGASISVGAVPLYKSQAMQLQGKLPCNTFWVAEKQTVDGEEFCAGAAASSACKADSGGPLFTSSVVGYEREPDKLVGILSKADSQCDARGIFDVYTTIDADWIEKVIAEDPTTLAQSKCP